MNQADDMRSEELAQGLRDTARWIQSRDPLATNYLYCIQAADVLSQAGQGVEERAELINILRERRDQIFDGECHLTNAVADRLIAALSHPAPSGEWEGVREALTKARRYPERIIELAKLEPGALTGEDLEAATRGHQAFMNEIDALLATLPPPGEAQRVDMGEVERIRRAAFKEAAGVVRRVSGHGFCMPNPWSGETSRDKLAADICALPSTPKQEG